MKTGDVKRIVEGARSKATSMGKAVTIVVVAPNGIAMALERVGDPPLFTSVVAEGKAAASVISGRDSAQLEGMAQRVPTLINAFAARNGGRFVALRGAVLLNRNDEVMGAVGVSGASAEEDEEIATAGAAAFGG